MVSAPFTSTPTSIYKTILSPAVILLDELEKAHKDVALILLQLLDEGTLTDSQGRQVNFKNTIICLTSNIGSDILSHPSATSPSTGNITQSAKNEVMERLNESFPPELLNRLDSIQIFNKLTKDRIAEIVELRLEDVRERLTNKRITLNVTPQAKEKLVEEGYSERYGARAIARIVRVKVLFPLAQKLLRGTIRDGDDVRVHVKEGSVVVEDCHEPEGGIGSPAKEVEAEVEP
jgi:ATP-dependent Clp protease ATP-binding subunit ClpB